MVQAIPPINHFNIPPIEVNLREDEEKANLKAASAQAIALYYTDTIASASNTPASTSSQTNKSAQAESVSSKPEKSFFQKVSDWFLDLFGWNDTATVDDTTPDVPQQKNPANELSPKLPQPDPVKSHLTKTIDEMKNLLEKINDISSFEEELSKSSSRQMDNLIFSYLIALSLSQKNLKEELREISIMETFDLQKLNQALQKKYHDLKGDILEREKLEQKLYWGNIAATGVVVASLAAATILTGPIATVAIATHCVASLVRGGVMFGETYHKGETDKKTGELVGMNHQMKENSGNMKDKMDGLQESTKEVSNLLKQIRHHLRNQSETASLFARNK